MQVRSLSEEDFEMAVIETAYIVSKRASERMDEGGVGVDEAIRDVSTREILAFKWFNPASYGRDVDFERVVEVAPREVPERVEAQFDIFDGGEKSAGEKEMERRAPFVKAFVVFQEAVEAEAREMLAGY